jgi:hypothetical protein
LLINLTHGPKGVTIAAAPPSRPLSEKKIICPATNSIVRGIILERVIGV